MAEYTNPEETTTTCEAPKAAKIQHTVFFKFPELVEGSADAAKMQEIVTEKFSSMPGIIAQFGPAGSRTLAKDEFLASVEWPDRSGGFTHHLHVIADDVACLKAYLHSDFHLKDWMAAVGPYGKGLVVFDSDFAVPLRATETTILHSALFKMPSVADGSEAHAAMLAVVAQFNTVPGVVASFRRAGHGPLSKEALLEALAWPDKSGGFTHYLCVVCDDDAALKGYLHGEPHKAWVPVARPNFEGDPPSLIFDCPLVLSAEV